MLAKEIVGLLIISSVTLACAEEDKYQAREERLEQALEGNESGLGSRPAWLVKTSSYASDDRTAVFFGYADNLQACSEFAEAMNGSDLNVTYACALAID